MTKAGIRLEVLLNATTRRDEQGNVIGVVGIGQDITGRLAQEREYTRLIDTANAPIFGVDTEGRVNVWNKCAMKLTGYPSEEVMGHSLVKEFIRKEHQEKVQDVIDQTLHGEETANFGEYELGWLFITISLWLTCSVRNVFCDLCIHTTPCYTPLT